MKNRMLIIGFLLLGVAIVAQSQSIGDAVMRLAIALFAFGCSGLLFGQKSFTSFGVAGTFSDIALLAIQARAEGKWDTNTRVKHMNPHVQTAQAIIENNTAQLAELQTGKDRTLSLIWGKTCNTTTTALSTECTIGGDELEGVKKDMIMNISQQHEFYVKEKEFRGLAMEPEEFIALGFKNGGVVLDNYLAATMIPWLNNFAGVNQWETGLAQGTGYDTIPAADWTADLFGEFVTLAEMNQFDNPFLLNGSNLKGEYWNAQMSAVNANDKDLINKFSAMKIYFDPWNVVTGNTPDHVTYMIDQGAVAFASKAYWDTTPRNFDGIYTAWKIGSQNLAGVEYDVLYKPYCVANEIEHHFRMTVNAGIWLNPLGCDSENTGVLRFFNNAQSGS
jgi:hypothetical protein